MTNLLTLLQTEGDNLVKEIQRDMASTGTNATGKTSESLNYEVKEEGGRITLSILGRPYTALIEPGRGPRKSSQSSNLASNILEWMQAKGVGQDLTAKQQINLARFLTLRINQRGTKLYQKGGRTDIYTEPFNNMVEKLNQEVVDTIADDFTKNIVITWNANTKQAEIK